MISKKDIKQICCLDKNWKLNNIKIKKVGGQTNRNYKVRYKNTDRFVRLVWEAADVVNRETEAKNILALAKCQKLASVLPKYYLYVFQGKNILKSKEKINFNLSDGTMVMEYIEGKDINGKELENSKIQESLLKSLHLFHSSGVKFVNPYDVFRDEILKYRKKAKNYPIGKLINWKIIKDIEEIEKIMEEKL